MKPTNLRITGKKSYLVLFTETHLRDPNYLAWLRDPEVMLYIGRPEYLEGPIPFASVDAYVRGQWESPYSTYLAMHALDGTFIGTVKMNFIDAQGFATSTIDLGIMIGNKAYWGKGIATDALEAAAAYCFDTLKVRKIASGFYARNVGMRKAFARIGFSEEGCIRKKLLVKDGWDDHVLVGCFPEELIRV